MSEPKQQDGFERLQDVAAKRGLPRTPTTTFSTKIWHHLFAALAALVGWFAFSLLFLVLFDVSIGYCGFVVLAMPLYLATLSTVARGWSSQEAKRSRLYVGIFVAVLLVLAGGVRLAMWGSRELRKPTASPTGTTINLIPVHDRMCPNCKAAVQIIVPKPDTVYAYPCPHCKQMFMFTTPDNIAGARVDGDPSKAIHPVGN